MRRAPVCVAFLIHVLLGTLFLGAETIPVSVESGVEISWQSSKEFEYQVQYAGSDAGAPWEDLGPRVAGNNARRSVLDPATGLERRYRVLQMRPGFVPASSVLANGSFEEGNESFVDDWTGAASHSPARSKEEAHSGSFSMHCKLVNVGAAPQEGVLAQSVGAGGKKIKGGASYDLSFWTKNISVGPSYIQQYHLDWLGESGEVLASRNFVPFQAKAGGWKKTSVPGLRAPDGAVDALIKFRFVTGAVANGHGEVYLDDVAFETGDVDPATQPRFVKVVTNPTSRISWPTRKNWIYLPFETVIDASGVRSSLKPAITGDGTTAGFKVSAAIAAEFEALRGSRISLLSPGDLSVTQSRKGQLTLEWKEVEGKKVTYRILHGTDGGLLSRSVDTGRVTMGNIKEVKAGETHYIAVLIVDAGSQ